MCCMQAVPRIRLIRTGLVPLRPDRQEAGVSQGGRQERLRPWVQPKPTDRDDSGGGAPTQTDRHGW